MIPVHIDKPITRDIVAPESTDEGEKSDVVHDQAELAAQQKLVDMLLNEQAQQEELREKEILFAKQGPPPVELQFIPPADLERPSYPRFQTVLNVDGVQYSVEVVDYSKGESDQTVVNERGKYMAGPLVVQSLKELEILIGRLDELGLSSEDIYRIVIYAEADSITTASITFNIPVGSEDGQGSPFFPSSSKIQEVIPATSTARWLTAQDNVPASTFYNDGAQHPMQGVLLEAISSRIDLPAESTPAATVESAPTATPEPTVTPVSTVIKPLVRATDMPFAEDFPLSDLTDEGIKKAAEIIRLAGISAILISTGAAGYSLYKLVEKQRIERRYAHILTDAMGEMSGDWYKVTSKGNHDRYYVAAGFQEVIRRLGQDADLHSSKTMRRGLKRLLKQSFNGTATITIPKRVRKILKESGHNFY